MAGDTEELRGPIRTFLIADVRGYTLFTQEPGRRGRRQACLTFAGVVREVVGHRAGTLLELRGDEALVVFDSPRQAIQATVELQGLALGALPVGGRCSLPRLQLDFGRQLKDLRHSVLQGIYDLQPHLGFCFQVHQDLGQLLVDARPYSHGALIAKRVTTVALILGLTLISMVPEAAWAWIVFASATLTWIGIRAARREL